MDLEKMMLMRDLKPYDKWLLENKYDGPIPIETIKNIILMIKKLMVKT